ncbi:MAG: sulfite exporter TauE/SafE family protein [Ruminococcaceae bacterium]|nr:sulfite exporter TauE/SafE family protein [Oscillospiraceae bacterium]
MKRKLITLFFGLFVGFVNGLLGAGGGMLAVPALKKMGLDQKDAHRNAVAVILPLTVFSAILYLVNGRVEFADCLIYLPGGLLGAGLGTVILKKISPKWLGVIFGGFMIYAGVRLILR